MSGVIRFRIFIRSKPIVFINMFLKENFVLLLHIIASYAKLSEIG
jgi:hypothetical protein